MKEFKGRILKGDRWYYESTYDGLQYCHDCSGNVLRDCYETPSWGYKGIGTVRLAAVMLIMAMTPDEVMDRYYPEGYEDDNGVWTDDEDAPPILLPSLGYKGDRLTYSEALRANQLGIVMKHMHAFADEVLANLPDNWEMSRQEILDWIEKREADETCPGQS